MTQTYTDPHQEFNEKTFYSALIADLNNARALVIIQSPYLAKWRLSRLLPHLEDCVRRRVRVCVYLRAPSGWDDRASANDEAIVLMREMVQSLRAIGVHVNIRKDIHEKLIVIDDSILWDGSLNPLSQSRSTERMYRFVSREKVVRCILAHNLGDCRQCPPQARLWRVLTNAGCGADVGVAFKNAREQRGVSQRQLAQSAQTSQALVSGIECGSRDPRISTVADLGKPVGVYPMLVPWYLVPMIVELSKKSPDTPAQV